MIGWMAGMGLFGLVMLLVVVAVVALAVYGAVRLIRRPRAGDTDGTPVRGDQALDGLRQRYAAGEIDKQEYDRRVAGLR